MEFNSGFKGLTLIPLYSNIKIKLVEGN